MFLADIWKFCVVLPRKERKKKTALPFVSAVDDYRLNNKIEPGSQLYLSHNPWSLHINAIGFKIVH